MGLTEAESKHLARIRASLQQLSQLLHRQWNLRFLAWGKGVEALDLAAKRAGEETTQFIRDLRGEYGWIPFQIISRDVVIVEHLGIRCEPTRTVSLSELYQRVSTRPFVGRIGWNGATKPGQHVPSDRVTVPSPARPVCAPSRVYPPRPKGFPGNNIGFYVSKRSTPAPAVPTAPAVSRRGRGRGRGILGWNGPLSTCRPPHFTYEEVFYPGTMTRRPGHERGAIHAPFPEMSSTSAPVPAVSGRCRGRERGRGQQRTQAEPTLEPGQLQARGGRFFH